MLFDQNRVDAIIHNWKNQVFSNETIQGVPQRHSTCLKPPVGGFRNLASRSSNSIVGYAIVYILRLIGHTHDRERPMQNFSTAPKKLGADISRSVWPPKPTEFGSYLVSFPCADFTALKAAQSERNERFLAGRDNFRHVRSAIEFEA